MKDKKTPQRMCVACRMMKDKKDLIRVVRCIDGEYKLDKTHKLNGRGAYVCNNLDCVKASIKSKALSRAFKCNIDKTVYDKLLEEFGKGDNNVES